MTRKTKQAYDDILFTGGVEIYTKKDSTVALRVEYGYSTENQLGCHNKYNTFAVATVGTMVGGMFVPLMWGEKDNVPEKWIDTPMDESGFDPKIRPDGHIDWNGYTEMVNDICERVFDEYPKVKELPN